MSDPAFRNLPPVHVLIARPELQASIGVRGRDAVLRAVRIVLDRVRETIRDDQATAPTEDALTLRVLEFLSGDRPRLRPVINATGILLHTGLGRAPLAEPAAEAVDRVVRGYCNLEFDLETGSRGHRTEGVSDLVVRLTGAEAATVVNNNAAATILALRTMAFGREVLVSRGQLVEIGGSFRLPEIFEVSGARLREVGTTNKTRLSDYERAIGPDSAALLRVHPSNFRVVGFTESVPIAELAMLARSRGLVTIDDLGSGSLGPGSPPGVSGEPTVAEGLSAGADLVLFSGDKLLGGPQCGILVGRKDAICRVSSDPLMRALRVDKMTLAALEATLWLALDPAQAARHIPLWRFLTTPLATLHDRANRLASRIAAGSKLSVDVVESNAFLGGGSVPIDPIPTAAVRLGPPWTPELGSEHALARALRVGDPAVVPRIHEGCVLLDLRAITLDQDESLADAVLRLVARRPYGR
ncbi:MAG: selA [Planctomycetota bacterium]|nr:selA [Planctomycetota bacterium]